MEGWFEAMADAYDARGVSKAFLPNVLVNPRIKLDGNLIGLLPGHKT